MSNLLKCELCEYESKQLFQHIKSEHNLSVKEYRMRFGSDKIMQINFTPPKNNVNEYNSSYVKGGYSNIQNKLDNIDEVYTSEETIKLLKTKYYYKDYFGRGKHRTLINKEPKLYKSIYHHTDILEDVFSKKHKGNYNFRYRLKFLVELKANIDKLKCKCKRTYTWNECCRKCSDTGKYNLNRPMSDESRLKCRLATLKYLESLSGKIVPRYNKQSIPIIEQYGEDNGYNFQHAENGGEFYIEELGYWVDGYDKEKNVVLEIDEKHHFDIDGNLREKDVIRQSEIENHLGCKFIRIKYE